MKIINQLKLKIVVIILALLLIFLIACQLTTTTKPTPTPRNIPLTLTSTLIVKLLPTQTTTPDSGIFTKCVAVDQSPKAIEKFPGSLIFSPLDSSEVDHYHIWETDTVEPFFEKGNRTANYSLSPKGNWLAYYADSSDGNLLVIQAINGLEMFTYKLNEISKEFNYIIGWSDNETISILFQNEDESKLDYTININPFTGEMEKMPIDYKSILSNAVVGRKVFWNPITVYDSTLSYVVYLADTESGNTKLILWDREKQLEIGSVEKFGYTSIKPIWTENSSGFFFVKAKEGFNNEIREDEWYFISNLGATKKLTKLTEQFGNSHIYLSSLSPNEMYLAFDINDYDEAHDVSKNKLLILDLEALKVYDYCLFTERFSNLVWSPDSRYLAYSEQLDDESIRTVVLDVIDGTAGIVMKNSQPNVWVDATELQGYFTEGTK